MNLTAPEIDITNLNHIPFSIIKEDFITTLAFKKLFLCVTYMRYNCKKSHVLRIFFDPVVFLSLVSDTASLLPFFFFFWSFLRSYTFKLLWGLYDRVSVLRIYCLSSLYVVFLHWKLKSCFSSCFRHLLFLIEGPVDWYSHHLPLVTR